MKDTSGEYCYVYGDPPRVPDRVLAGPAIIAARKANQLLIEPFDERCINGSSVDVRLGHWYYEEQPAPKEGYYSLSTIKANAALVARPSSAPQSVVPNQVWAVPVLNPWDPLSVSARWGQPKMASPLDEDLPGIPKGTPVIMMPPKSVMLAHTHEFIGSLDPELTFMVKTRSSVGRNFIRTASCAGWGDQGYAWRITLELANDSRDRWAILVPGRRVTQIVFLPTTELPPEALYFMKGKYQQQNPIGKTFDELEWMWKPTDMLPKQHFDFELQDPTP